MKDLPKLITIQELIDKMEFLSSIHDVVRIVDPIKTEILKIEDGKIIGTELDSCFSIWDRNERCLNCISKRACEEHQRFLKFEFREKEVYSVVATPFLLDIDGKTILVSLECANNVTENAIVNFDNNNHHLTEVAIVRDKIYRDSLTGLYNRRYYDEGQFIRNLQENVSEKICFLVCDLDHFKEVNDTYGHDCGDELLSAVAKVIRNSIRSTDCVIRTGGDEFLIILHNAEPSLAERKMEMIRKNVSEIKIEKYDVNHPVISIGYACMEGFVGTEEQQNELYKKADEAMYHEKKLSENK